MQKTYNRILGSMLLLIQLLDAKECCVSHQFIPRSITTDLVYTDMLNYYQRHNKDEHKRFIYSGNFIYQQSRKSETLGSAFLLKNDQNCVNVLQNSLGLNPPTDINSYWLGLFNNSGDPFASRFCIEPERKLFAYYNYMYFDLRDLFCGLWADVAFAVLSVKHKLNCCESGNTASSCSDITTVAQALNNSVYNYSKFNCGDACHTLNRAGVDDVQLRLGYEGNWCDDRHIWGLYLIGTIPTGHKPNAEYVFEPLIGSKHGSVGVGFNMDYQMGNNFTLLFDANYRYALKHHEYRTFDLCKNGAFSRFLLIAKETDPNVAYPGVNFFTQNIEVSPRSTLQAWLALHYERCNYEIEGGYNFFWRQQEQIGCPVAFDQNIGIYGLNNMPDTSASTATISQGPTQVVRDATFVTLSASDLNLSSGAAARALSNKFYGIVSREGSICAMDWSVGLGGSYEFVNGTYECSTLPFWAIFGQFSLFF